MFCSKIFSVLQSVYPHIGNKHSNEEAFKKNKKEVETANGMIENLNIKSEYSDELIESSPDKKLSSDEQSLESDHDTKIGKKYWTNKPLTDVKYVMSR